MGLGGNFLGVIGRHEGQHHEHSQNANREQQQQHQRRRRQRRQNQRQDQQRRGQAEEHRHVAAGRHQPPRRPLGAGAGAGARVLHLPAVLEMVGVIGDPIGDGIGSPLRKIISVSQIDHIQLLPPVGLRESQTHLQRVRHVVEGRFNAQPMIRNCETGNGNRKGGSGEMGDLWNGVKGGGR